MGSSCTWSSHIRSSGIAALLRRFRYGVRQRGPQIAACACLWFPVERYEMGSVAGIGFRGDGSRDYTATSE